MIYRRKRAFIGEKWNDLNNKKLIYDHTSRSEHSDITTILLLSVKEYIKARVIAFYFQLGKPKWEVKQEGQ